MGLRGHPRDPTNDKSPSPGHTGETGPLPPTESAPGARPQGPGAFFWRLIGVREPGVGKGRARSYDRIRDPLLAHFCPMGLPAVADLPMAK